jgi:hypothetical protein
MHLDCAECLKLWSEYGVLVRTRGDFEGALWAIKVHAAEWHGGLGGAFES